MDIIILSSGRPLKQTTWDSLPPVVQERTKLLVPYDEASSYANHNYPIITHRDIIRDVTKARQWLVENMGSRLCMLDDDLTFAIRREDNPVKFREATPEDIANVFADIESLLDAYAHVSIASREGGNRRIEKYLYNTRAMRILACRTDILKEHSIRYDRLKLMSDFDVTLQLLRKGEKTCIINYAVNNQGGSNAKGGCSQYRTPEMQTRDAHLLKELHPQFVRLKQVQTKVSWGGVERTDVTCYWKKAYESSAHKT